MPTIPPGQYLALPSSGEDPSMVKATTVSTGAGSAGQIPALGPNGKFDPSLIDATQFGAPDTEAGVATESLTAGDLVNTFLDTTVTPARNGVRRANASAFATRARGFVRESVSAGANVTVYKSGTQNNQMVGLTIGQQWLSDTQSGRVVSTPPQTSGSVMQKVGYASSATTLHVKIEPAFGIA